MRRLLRSPVLLATAVYFVLTAVLTWPLMLHPASLVPNDLGDPLLNTWLMSWNAHVLPLTTGWWNAPQFFPVAGAMAFSEHLLGLSLITTPVIWMSGSPLLGYNVAFFLSFPLCALSAYFLTYSIAGRHDCAFVSGLAFGFAPYRMAQFAHVQVLSAYWMPIALAALHRYFQPVRLSAAGPRLPSHGPGATVPAGRWLVVFAAAWLLQALTCGYYLIYLSVLIGLWLFWFVVGREKWTGVARAALAWMAAAALMAPVLYGYWTFQRAYGMRRGPVEIMAFSADVASLFKASDNIRLWGWLDVIDRAESSLFPGITPIVLIVVALAIAWRTASAAGIPRLRAVRVLVSVALVFFAVAGSYFYFGAWKLEPFGLRILSVATPHKPLSVGLLLLAAAGAMHPAIRSAWRRRSALSFYALAAVTMWLFSLGPAPTLMGRPFIYKAPYAWLLAFPGVDGVRVPARFWMLAVLCLAVAAGLAMRQLTAKWPRLATALPVVACLGLLSDAWPVAMPMLQAPDMRPVHAEAIARLELPISPLRDTIALYRATGHKRPLFNGYSGYFAPHYWALQYLLDHYDPEVLTRLATFGPVEVVIDHASDDGGAWRQFVAGHPQAEQVYQDRDYTVYRLQRGSHAATLPKVEGQPLPIAAISATVSPSLVQAMTDHDRISRWHAGREQRPGDGITIDLGQPREVSGAEMLIGGYVADFPRQLSIETSLDGQGWAQAWSGGTALIAFSAALEDPLDVTLPFSFASRPARYVRFTQTGSERIYYWSIAELRIDGK